MTEEEKKEFKEFLQWKKEREAKTEKSEELQNNKEETEAAKDEEVKVQIKGSEPKPVHLNDNKGDISVGPVIVLVIAILVVLIMGIVLSNNNNQVVGNLEETEGIDEIEAVDTVAVGEAEPEPRKVMWDFTIQKDEMTDTKNIWAKITSDDYVYQDFPYEGMTYAYITVRYMKKYGYDVIIEITKGQINGQEYYGTHYITARFDEGAPKKYYFNKAADGSSTMVFLRSSSDFIKRCKQAKDIKIDIPLYKGGRPVFNFHVDEPLVWREE